MKALRITGWSRFEKSDHKKCKNMSWIATPTSHDGIGFLRLLTSPDGLRRYGGWHLILQVAAKCPVHGLLVSDAGRPLGAAEIALKTRASEADINDAIQACCEIGWLESVEISGTTPEASGETPQPSCLQDRTLQDKTGQSAAAPPPAQDAAAAPDLGFMDEMQAAPPMREFAPKTDWNLWRQTHSRLFIGRSDEDGSVADWRALFDRAGPVVMDAMYAAVIPAIANPRHGVGFKAATEWINDNTEPA